MDEILNMNLDEIFSSLNKECLLSNGYNLTDKGISGDLTGHDYINTYYSKEFTDKKDKNIALLEIGIYKGGSLLLWRKWFKNAKIIGIDNGDDLDIKLFDKIKDDIEIIIGDAYSEEIISLFKDETFDYIIDDGAHSLESHKISIQKWMTKLKSRGKLIIEDVPQEDSRSNNWIIELKNITNNDIIKNFTVFNTHRGSSPYLAMGIIIEIVKI